MFPGKKVRQKRRVAKGQQVQKDRQRKSREKQHKKRRCYSTSIDGSSSNSSKSGHSPSSDKEGTEGDDPVVSQKDTSKNGFPDKLATYATAY